MSFKDLNGKIPPEMEKLQKLFSNRQHFEKETEQITQWLIDCESVLNTDINIESLNGIQDQLKKFVKWENEAETIGVRIEDLIASSNDMKLTNLDSITVADMLSVLKTRYLRVSNGIKDHNSQLAKLLEKYMYSQKKIDDSLQLIRKVQGDLQRLNQPIGRNVEDVYEKTAGYQHLLHELRNWRVELNDVDSLPELQEVVYQMDDLISTINLHLAKLKPALALREQFNDLVSDITMFITKYTEIVREVERPGHSAQDKIKKYEEVIGKIQETEAKLVLASDKGEQIGAEGSIIDRNSILEQLQILKQQLLSLRKTVEQQIHINEATAANQAKLVDELVNVMDWFYSHEADIHSRPLLLISIESVQDEISKHEILKEELETHLNEMKKLKENMQDAEGFPSSIKEKLSESQVLLTRVPAELQSRGEYLNLNVAYREEYESLREKFFDWTREGGEKLGQLDDGINLENAKADLEEHRAFFNNENSIRDLISQNMQSCCDLIRVSLTPEAQEDLVLKQQQLTQVLKNTLNSARSRQASLEQAIIMWQEYRELVRNVNNILDRAMPVDEPVATLSALLSSVQHLSTTVDGLHHHRQELDLLVEKADELKRVADEKNRREISTEVDEVTDRWNLILKNLETKRDTLNQLASDWNHFEANLHNFESSVSFMGQNLRDLDQVIRSKDHLIQIQETLEGFLKESEDFASYHVETVESSKHIFAFLDENSDDGSAILQNHLQAVLIIYNTLLQKLKQNKAKLQANLDNFNSIEKSITDFGSELLTLKQEIRDLNIFDSNQASSEESTKILEDRILDRSHRVKELCLDTRHSFTTSQKFVPEDLSHKLTTLELLAEEVVSQMDEKSRYIKRARTIRSDYNSCVDAVQKWLQEVEVKVQDRIIEPSQLKESVQQLFSEIPAINERLEKASENGKLITENSKNNDEKRFILTTLDSLSRELTEAKVLIEGRKSLVDKSVESWKKFLKLYETVRMWIAENKAFTSEALLLSNLSQTKQITQTYWSAAKSCRQAVKNVSDMSKELEVILHTTDTTKLNEKMDEAKYVYDIEAILLEKTALLSELIEEWEQCERKLKEVNTFIERTHQTLDTPPNKKQTLRDQLASKEKLLADITIQKNKLNMSVEKLEVHFRSGNMSGDGSVKQNSNEIINRLDSLLTSVQTQVHSIENSLSQIESYQQEIQTLHGQVIHLEQQLRLVQSPLYSSQDKEKAAQEQNSYRDRIQVAQNKVSALMERIKLINQHGLPGTELFRTF